MINHYKKKRLFVFIILIFLFSVIPTSATISFSDTREWILENKTYIGELMEVNIDNEKDEISIVKEANVGFNSIDNTNGNSLLDYAKDIKKINQYPVILEIWEQEANVYETCDKNWNCEYTQKEGPEIIFVKTKEIKLKPINALSGDTIKNALKTVPNYAEGRLRVGFGTISFSTTDLYTIHLVASAGEGDSEENAFTFQDIIDYFEANPIASWYEPADLDFTEDDNWNWTAGPMTWITSQPTTDSILVEDTTEFTGNNLNPFDRQFPTYANCSTIVSGTEFDDCVAYKYWGSYGGTLLDFRGTQRVMEADHTAYITQDAGDKQVGDYSLKISTGAADDHAFMSNIIANENMLNMYLAEEMYIWVKVSDSKVVLKTLETRDKYSTNGRSYYDGVKFELNQTFTANTWTMVNVTIREYGLHAKRGESNWCDEVDSVILTFNDSSNSDIWIDGGYWYTENPNPRETTNNVLFFPIRLNTKGLQDRDFWFKDGGKTLIFNWLHGNWYFNEINDDSTWILGLPSNETNKLTPKGLNIFWNTWDSGMLFNIVGAYTFGHGAVEMEGVKFSSAFYPDYTNLGGIGPRIADVVVNRSSIKDTIIEGAFDVFINWADTIENVDIKASRYVIWGEPEATANISDLRIWLNEGLIRNHAGNNTYRHIEIVEHTTGNNLVFLYDPSATEDNYIKFIDMKYSDGFFDPTEDGYWYSLSLYSAWCNYLQIGNSVKALIRADEGEAVSGASVTVKDKNDNIVWTDVTDSNGETGRHDVIHSQYFGGCNAADDGIFYLANPTTTYYPFTVTIEKSGYQTATIIDSFNQTDSTEGYIIGPTLLSEKDYVSEMPITIYLLILWFVTLIMSVLWNEKRIAFLGISTFVAFVITFSSGVISGIKVGGEEFYFPMVWLAKIFFTIFFIQAIYLILQIYKQIEENAKSF